jgi:hypothetical protein
VLDAIHVGLPVYSYMLFWYSVFLASLYMIVAPIGMGSA